MDSFLIQHNSRKKEKNCSERPLKLIEFVLQNFDSTYHIYEKWSYLYNFSNLKFILQQNEYKLFNVSFSFQLNYFFFAFVSRRNIFLIPMSLRKMKFFFLFFLHFWYKKLRKNVLEENEKLKLSNVFLLLSSTEHSVKFEMFGFRHFCFEWNSNRLEQGYWIEN